VRKVLSAVLVASMLAVLFMSVPAVRAKQSEPEPIRCEMVIVFDPMSADPHWIGPLTGDIAGTIEFWETSQNYVVGKTEHFFEKMVITTDKGDIIKGTDAGVWNFPTYKFRANGWVAEASGQSSYLVGYKMHEMGVTTPFPPVPPATTVTGTASMFLVAP